MVVVIALGADLSLAVHRLKLLAHEKLYTRADGTSGPKPGLE